VDPPSLHGIAISHVTPDRWRQIESVYHAALKRDVRSRSAFLEEVCVDDRELRLEVESLLSLETEAEDFLETPRGPWLLTAADYLLSQRVLQVALILPVFLLAWVIFENRDDTVGNVIGRYRGYLSWIVIAALILTFRHRIRTRLGLSAGRSNDRV